MCLNGSAVVLIIHLCICVTEEELKLQLESSLQMRLASWPSENVSLEKQKLIRDAFMVFLANTINM